jgi:hypothetical protein
LLQSEAQAAVADIAAHLTAEEAAVLPVLERHCSTGQQRALVCGVLEAMPLRVLEHLIGRLGALVDKPQVSQGAGFCPASPFARGVWLGWRA